MQILSYRRQSYYLLLVFHAPYAISCTKTGKKRHKNIINTLKYRHLTAIFSILNITSLIHNNYFMSYLMRKSDFWFTERFRPSRLHALVKYTPSHPAFFYIVKMRFTGAYIFFLIFALKHRLWVFVRLTIYLLIKNKKKI